MEFRLLGPLEVVGEDGAAVALGGKRPRALLARLLLSPNEVVPADRLVDAVWGEQPPATAASALHVHVHALRSALGADRIETRPPGYRLRVEPDELDVERFHALVARGDAAALTEALSLWRGPALADLADEAFARADAARLDDARLAALEARIDADLEAGRHDVLTGELEGLAATHPHRERFHAQRMIALYRAGQAGGRARCVPGRAERARRARPGAVGRSALARAADPSPGREPRRAGHPAAPAPASRPDLPRP